jgi:hypothetical protein
LTCRYQRSPNATCSSNHPDEIEAVLSDGTHIKAEYQLDGTRLGFARPLPVGTRILLGGILGWVVGSTPTEQRKEPGS